MRFMTMSWWAGDDTSDRASEYGAHVESIWETLPRSVQELSRIPCHDASVMRLELSAPRRELFLNMELAGTKRGNNLHILYRDIEQFISIGRPDAGLAGPGGYGDLGYDEVDIAGPGTFVHRLLFSNGIEFEITFGDVDIKEIPSPTSMSEP